MKPSRSLAALLAAAAAGSVLALAPASAQEPASSQAASSAASPAPSATASPRPGCGAPPFQSINVEPVRAAPGDTVTVTVTVRDEPCYPDESAPHDVQLLAAREPNRDPAPLTRGTTDRSGRFVYVETATASTTYYLTALDGRQRGGNSSASVTVDRTAGTCANAITLYAQQGAATGESVMVSGTSSDTSTVAVSFRKRGETSFTVRRRVEPAGQQGTFVVYFKAHDDYRLFASNERCESQPILVTAAPVITGPSLVRKGSTVTLTVRAAAGMPLAVAFRRAGQTTFTVRRTGTANSSGAYTTTYRADADYQYYAAERPGQQSARRITQAR